MYLYNFLNIFIHFDIQYYAIFQENQLFLATLIFLLQPQCSGFAIALISATVDDENFVVQNELGEFIEKLL